MSDPRSRQPDAGSSRTFEAVTRREIAGRARTLIERLDDLDAVTPTDGHDPDVEGLLAAWREQFPSEDAFQRRLDHLGVGEAEVRRALGAGRLADDEPLPGWVERVDRIVTAVQSTSPGDHPAHLAPADSHPEGSWPERRFGPLSAAIAAHARSDLPYVVHETLPAEAVGAMAEWLRGRFETRFTRILYVEFKTFVAAHDPELARADPAEFDDPPTELYERFLAYLFSGGFAEFCELYPMFARLLATQLRQWDEHLREFVSRLRDDRAALADRFGDGDELGAVVGLRPLADDTHGDGRAVMQVVFESGLTVVYKPRSVDAGVAVADLIDRLNDHLPAPDLRMPAYLARDGYGWAEWVEGQDCEDEAAVERFYRRAGALTCLAYLLEFTDLQHENLVAAGEQPVAVDAETVLHPYVAPNSRPFHTDVAALPDGNVLLTRLLPYAIARSGTDANNDIAVITAGFLAEHVDETVEDFEWPRVTAANTDVMAVEQVPATVERSDTLPAIDGTTYPAGEFVDAFVGAFEDTFEAMASLQEAGRLSSLGVPDALAGVENRLIYRATMRYAITIKSLGGVACLRDGARFDIEIEALAAPFCDGTVDDPPWPIYDAERRALRRLDPPRFTARTDGTAIRFEDEPVGVAADRSGFDRAADRLASLDETLRREQAEYVRCSVGGTPGPDGSRRVTGGESRTNHDAWEYTPMSDEAFRREAVELFDCVRDAGTTAGDGFDHWKSVRPPTGIHEPLPFTLRPADRSIYVGRCGIALLGAALYRVEGEERYRAFAERTAESVRSTPDAGREIPASAVLGGASGLGGVVYGLGVVGDLLDDDEIIDDARRAAGSIHAETIREDSTLDVVSGSAGTILALCAVHDRTGDASLLEPARECANHLLASRIPADGTDGVASVAGNPRVWKTLDGHPPLTGFAHGQGGIAYALLRLWDATGRPTYRDAALEALTYESAMYSEDAGNWLDLRAFDEVGPYPDQWCYGRTGIGLARLGSAAVVEDEVVARGVERAITNVPDAGLGSVDHLCCGDAGRADFLLEVERRLGRRAGEARELLDGVLARKRETGDYRRLAWTAEIVDPTLFHGVSGIAYQMLRVTAPEELPCLLLWE